jgi:tRNA dimethylallyltransferase
MEQTSDADPDLLVVLGATASGKTSLAVALARTLQTEIISADSRQVYQGMDIGTGNDLHEYGEIPVHLIDRVRPDQEYNVFAYQRDFLQVYQPFKEAGNCPLLVGGSGLYLDAVIAGYQFSTVPENPELRQQLQPLNDDALRQMVCEVIPSHHNQSDLQHRVRMIRAIEIALYQKENASQMAVWPVQAPLIVGVSWPRDQLRKRITQRLKQRLEQGMIDEVKGLVENGISYERLDYFGLEYRFVGAYLLGKMGYNDFYQRLNSAIHQFAKRQDTWFRRMERSGQVIHWVRGGESAVEDALEVLRRESCLVK